MKTHQLILLTSVLFVTLFYGEEMGLNFGILGVSYALLTLYDTPETNRTRTFLILFVMSILSSVAFAWYGDFASFLAVFTSLFLLVFKSRNCELKSLLVIPVFAVNFITFVYRLFKFDEWLPKTDTSATFKRMVSVIFIPSFLILAFFGVYSLGSTHFAGIFSKWNFTFDIWQFVVLSGLGFFIAFNFWNFKVEKFIFSWNHYLKNDFVNEDKVQKPATAFLDVGAERKSGIISLVALNVLIVIFIVTFNYEQFVETSKTAVQLSSETHDRVNAVILSIVMAVLVIMYYFKGFFNFDNKANSLKLLAKIWIILNAVLVLSAAAKNAEYVMTLGFTYKRLGVFAFLIVSLIGLALTFSKIYWRKTNAYLINHIVWYFYGTVLVCSFINWGGFMTSQNLKKPNFDLEYHQKSVTYNERELLDYAQKRNNDKLIQDLSKKLRTENEKSFLSKILIYQTLK